MVTRPAAIMSRIADVLKRAREESGTVEQHAARQGPRLRSIDDVKVSWSIDEAVQQPAWPVTSSPSSSPVESSPVPLQTARLIDSLPKAPDAAVASLVQGLFLSGDGSSIHRVLFTPVDDSADSIDVVVQIAV